MSGGGGGSTTTNQIDQRFSPLIDYATQTAAKVNSQGFTPFTGQRYADMNASQNAGIDMIQQRAQNGDPTMNQAQSTIQDMLKGGTNPYLDSMVSKAQQSVMGQMNTAGANSGSFGNSGVQANTADSLGNVATQMYGNAYNQDQSNKLSALGMAQNYGNQSYQDAAQLLKAGGQQQDQQQNKLDFGYQQFQDQQNLPYKQMAAYSGLLGSSGANSSSTTSGGGK